MVKKNPLLSMFNELNKSKIPYSTNADLKRISNPKKIYFPKGPNKPDKDMNYKHPVNPIGKLNISLEKKNLSKAINIVKSLGFIFHNYNEGFSYFLYDKNLGLLWIKISTTDGINNFSTKNPPFRGKVICVVGPNGSGKTTNMHAIKNILKEFPVKKVPMYFSTGGAHTIPRLFSRASKIMQVYWNKTSGKITLTDRYIFLSFRFGKRIKHIVRKLSPTPDLIFLTEASYSTLKTRRSGKKLMKKRGVESHYELFKSLPGVNIINTEKPMKENMPEVINKILELFSDQQNEKKYLNRFI